MFVAIRPMRVPVSELVLGGRPDCNHLDFKSQVYTRQRMIGIQGHRLVIHGHHRNNRRITVSVGLKKSQAPQGRA